MWAGAATPPKRGTVKQLPPPLETQADDPAALAQVIAYYHATLKQSPEALDYLRQRGLMHPALIERFRRARHDHSRNRLAPFVVMAPDHAARRHPLTLHM
jgi:hypothetical protein